MRIVLTLTVVLISLPLFAQGRGGGGGFGGAGGGMGGGEFSQTPFDRLVDDLDLDRKTQAPAVAALIDAATPEAAAIFEELVARRQALLNVATNQSADPAPAQAYAASLQRLFAIEARVFADIYARLTPKQREKAAKGFERLEALFKSGLSVSGRAGGAGRMGPGAMGPGGMSMPRGGR